MKYGLIGERLGHSFSREIHKKIADYEYELCEIQRDELDHYMRVREFCGVNVTIPFKEAVIPLLDVVSPHALEIGAVNTVVNIGGGLIGYNTDYLGALSMLEYAGIELGGKKVLILGTGGTSKTMAYVAKRENAREIFFVSREAREGAVTYEEAYKRHLDADVIINTTPVGMYPNTESCPIDIQKFTSLSGVADVIYNPLETKLVRAAKTHGIKAVGGLYMLVAQAVYASAKFRNTDADKALIEKIYNEIKLEKMNVILCGMPSCGKSTVGEIIARRLGREFIDTDDEIVKKDGREIREIFDMDGEATFRRLEREVIAEVSKKSGVVISLGGGAVLDSRNVESLSQNGILFFIDRPLSMLTATADRPLSSDSEALGQRYTERYPIYVAVSKITVDGSGDPNEVAEKILEVMKNENSCN